MKKRIVSLLLVICLIVSLCSCGIPGSNNTANTDNTSNTSNNSENNADNTDNTNNVDNTQADFDAFVDEQYRKSIEESYTIMHQYYLDPKAAGFNMNNVEVSLGLVPDDAEMEEDRAYYASLRTRLGGFDREKLTRQQQDIYDSLEWEINSAIALSDSRFDYYEQIFSPPRSLDTNIVSLFTSWELRNEQDMADLVKVLDSIPAYVDSAIAYARKQQEKKLLMTDFDQVISDCEDVVIDGMKSFVLEHLLKQADEIEGVEAAKKEEYKTEISNAFERSYLPAFTAIKDAMEDMSGGYNNTGGYAQLPNGADYYQVLLNYTLGTYGVSCKEFETRLTEYFSKEIVILQQLYSKDPNAITDFYNSDYGTGYTDYAAILEDVKVKMMADHPEIKNLEYNIENADPGEKLDEKSVLAYFVTPPVDGAHMQQMRVNPSTTEMDSVQTYMTVTHEGFPGHMYQFAYMYEHWDSDYIKTLGVDGIVEGYAVYSQYHALEYLSDMSESIRELYALDEKLAYLIYCLADVGINYSGWTIEDTLEYLSGKGFSLSEESAKKVYDLLRLAPTYFQPYGYGYEFIAELRNKAEDKLGDKFSVLEFNTALLNAGATPCKVVTRYIDEYIESAGK